MATHNLSCPLDRLALLDKTIGAEEHDTYLSCFKVHAHAFDARSEPDPKVSVGPRMYQVDQMTDSTSSSAWTLFMPWIRAIPSLRSPIVSLPSSCQGRDFAFSQRTQQTKHAQFRLDRPLLARHECAALGSRILQWVKL